MCCTIDCWSLFRTILTFSRTIALVACKAGGVQTGLSYCINYSEPWKRKCCADIVLNFAQNCARWWQLAASLKLPRLTQCSVTYKEHISATLWHMFLCFALLKRLRLLGQISRDIVWISYVIKLMARPCLLQVFCTYTKEEEKKKKAYCCRVFTAPTK